MFVTTGRLHFFPTNLFKPLKKCSNQFECFLLGDCVAAWSYNKQKITKRSFWRKQTRKTANNKTWAQNPKMQKKQHGNMHLTWRIYFTRTCWRSAQTVKKRGIKNNRPSLDNQPSALRIYYWTLQLDFFALRLRRISRILAVQVKSDEIITGRYKG